MIARNTILALVVLFCCSAIMGCRVQQQADKALDRATIACEGTSGWHEDVVPGSCTKPCPVDQGTQTTIELLAKSDADSKCRLEGKTSCDGQYSEVSGSCSTVTVGKIPHCRFRVSIEYSGNCI